MTIQRPVAVLRKKVFACSEQQVTVHANKLIQTGREQGEITGFALPIYCFIFQSASQENNNNYLELNRRTRGIWAEPAQRRMKQYSILFLQVGQETTNLIPAKRQKQFI